MKIAIIYDSMTGNTKMVAEAINEACEKEEVIIMSVKDALKNNSSDEIDLYFLGSWTDKGNCGDSMKEYCNNLSHKKVAIFGTAGFGGAKEYYETIGNRFYSELPNTSIILGMFCCQGKMPVGIKNRFLSALEKNPDDNNLKNNIENFDAALSHPDFDDLNNAKIFVKEMLDKLYFEVINNNF